MFACVCVCVRKCDCACTHLSGIGSLNIMAKQFFAYHTGRPSHGLQKVKDRCGGGTLEL